MLAIILLPHPDDHLSLPNKRQVRQWTCHRAVEWPTTAGESLDVFDGALALHVSVRRVFSFESTLQAICRHDVGRHVCGARIIWIVCRYCHTAALLLGAGFLRLCATQLRRLVAGEGLWVHSIERGLQAWDVFQGLCTLGVVVDSAAVLEQPTAEAPPYTRRHICGMRATMKGPMAVSAAPCNFEVAVQVQPATPRHRPVCCCRAAAETPAGSLPVYCVGLARKPQVWAATFYGLILADGSCVWADDGADEQG